MERILHFVIGTMNYGGISTNLMTIYRNIDKNKYQFDFISHSNKNEYGEEIRRMGGNIYAVPFKSMHPKTFKKEIDEILRDHPEYKVIHIHTSYAGMYYEAKIAKNHHKIVIMHSHASNGDGFKRKVLNFFLKKRLEKVSDYKLAVSDLAAQWLYSKRVIKNKDYKILNNSIDTNMFQYDCMKRKMMRREYHLEESFVLGITTRLSRGKNVFFLIDLMDSLRIDLKKCVLLIVGDGEEREAIEKRILNKKLSDRIIMAGKKENVADYLNMFDVFVFPSLHEGLGLSVIEAVSTGLPCIINKKLPKELLIEQSVYAESLKLADWKKAILDIYQKGEKREGKTELVARSGFDMIGNTKKWEQFYGEVIR